MLSLSLFVTCTVVDAAGVAGTAAVAGAAAVAVAVAVASLGCLLFATKLSSFATSCI